MKYKIVNASFQDNTFCVTIQNKNGHFIGKCVLEKEDEERGSLRYVGWEIAELKAKRKALKLELKIWSNTAKYAPDLAYKVRDIKDLIKDIDGTIVKLSYNLDRYLIYKEKIIARKES